jgi:hypothetical protein
VKTADITLSSSGEVTVWVVDGQYVRENLDKEFTNFGHHLLFHFIPSLIIKERLLRHRFYQIY